MPFVAIFLSHLKVRASGKSVFLIDHELGDSVENLAEQLLQTQERMFQLMDIAKRASEVPVGSFEADDRSGSIRVRLAQDGLPESIRLLPGWRNKCGVVGVSAAILAAAHAALEKRTTSWGQALDDTGVAAMILALEQQRGTRPASVDFGRGFLEDMQTPAEQPRELSLITEDMLSLLDSFDRASEGDSPTGGASGGGLRRNVSIVLTDHAMQSCSIDSHWAEREDDRRIDAELRSALLEAREILASRGAGFRDRTSALISELMSKIVCDLKAAQQNLTNEGSY